MTIQHVPSKGRISIIKIQNFTIQKRQSVIRIVYGGLFAIIALVMVIGNPIDLFTNWYIDLKEGSFVFRMWEKPTYQIFSEVWIYNYTNVPEYLRGDANKLNLKVVGPFTYREFRTNENMKIDRERGVLTLKPNVTLKFLPEESVAHPKDVNIYVPNIALIAFSTLAADKLGFLANAGAYYSISALGSKLFRNLTVDEFLKGYDDPLVTIASNLLPGWIDFGKIGIMDRLYAKKTSSVEMEIKDASKRFSIISWDNSPGLVEQGFTDLNTSTLCNRIQGSYEGLMLAPNVPKDKIIPIFRKQACRIYPFVFDKEVTGDYGFNYYRFVMEKSAFSKSSPYACNCTRNCLPEGFIDVSNCFYGFPIALSKPHFEDVDPKQMSYYKGMKPNPEKYISHLDIEPTVGAPLALSSSIQVNIAVRTSPANPITKPLKDKVLPLLWLSMSCKQPPAEVLSILRLRFVIAPPLVITIEILFFITGVILGIQGFYRILRPRYTFIQPKHEPTPIITRDRVSINIADNKSFKCDDDLAKEAVSLLSIKEEDIDLSDLLITET